ncbi:MAG: phosphoglycerate dehydrogenase [bacterium]|jgi:D-3-phosphoglycerate dehydrogenase
MYKVLVTDNLSQNGVEILRQAEGLAVEVKNTLPPQDLLQIIGDYHALIIRSGAKVTEAVLEAGKNLKVVGRAGIGVDNVDVASASARGVLVMNTPGGNTITTAEHAISMLLALARSIPQATASMKEGKWEKNQFMGVELYQKTLGIIGMGRIGSEVARRAKGMMMEVIAYDPFISAEVAQEMGVQLADLDRLFAESDFITLHTPLTEETRNLINEGTLSRMKDGVRIINCARGGIVNEQALYQALKSGKVAGAALDVFEKEPLKESPLLELTNFICTPHLGASTAEAQENVAIAIARQVIDYLKRGVIRNAVNAPSIEPEVLSKIQPYLDLAERLGSLESQLSEGRIEEIRIDYRGEIASMDLAPLTVAIVKGVLSPILQEMVNTINALPFAKGRGIRVVESKSGEDEDFASIICVGLKTDKGQSEVAGTVVKKREPRVIRINEFRLEAIPKGHILIFCNIDTPGVLGKIGCLLGESQVNIASIQLSREKAGGRALSLVNVDQPVPPETLERLRNLPNIVFAKLVKI